MSIGDSQPGKPAWIPLGNGTPQGPRVKRAGWSGWWLHSPTGELVPDPDGPPPRRAEPRTLQRMAPIRDVHGCGHAMDRKYIAVVNGKDTIRCRECRRLQMQRYRMKHAA